MFPPEVERWRPLVQQYVAPQYVDKFLWMIQHESGGNPSAIGDNGVAIGLTQVQDNNVFSNRPSREWLLDPVNNIRYAAQQLGAANGDFSAWGDSGNTYNGQPFGAFGHNTYPGNTPAGGGRASTVTSDLYPAMNSAGATQMNPIYVGELPTGGSVYYDGTSYRYGSDSTGWRTSQTDPRVQLPLPPRTGEPPSGGLQTYPGQTVIVNPGLAGGQTQQPGGGGNPNDFGGDEDSSGGYRSYNVTQHDGSIVRITEDQYGNPINFQVVRGPGGATAQPQWGTWTDPNTKIVYPIDPVTGEPKWGSPISYPQPQQPGWQTWRDPNTGVVYYIDPQTGFPDWSNPVSQPAPAAQPVGRWQDPNTGIVWETDHLGKLVKPISAPAQQPNQGDYKDFTNTATGEVVRHFFDAQGRPTGEKAVIVPASRSAQNTGGSGGGVDPNFQRYAMEMQLQSQLAKDRAAAQREAEQLELQRQQQAINLMNARQNAARNYADVISTVDPAAYNAFVQAGGGNIANALYMDPDGALSDKALQPGVEALRAIRELDKQLAGVSGGGSRRAPSSAGSLPSFAEWQARQGQGGAGAPAPRAVPDYRTGYGVAAPPPSPAPVAAPVGAGGAGLQPQVVAPNITAGAGAAIGGGPDGSAADVYGNPAVVAQPSGFALDQVAKGAQPQTITWAGPTSLMDVDPSVYVMNPDGTFSQGGSGNQTLTGTAKVVRLAQGGYTTAPMMMTGDAAHANPEAGGARPEVIMNPTRAPLMVVPNEAVPQVVSMPRFNSGTLGGLTWGGGVTQPRQPRQPAVTGAPDSSGGGYAAGNPIAGLFNRKAGLRTNGQPVTTPSTGGGGGGSIIDEVRDTRTNVTYPNLNTYNVQYELMDPVTRAAFEQGQQTKYNIPVESTQFEWLKYRLPGASRGQVALGY